MLASYTTGAGPLKATSCAYLGLPCLPFLILIALDGDDPRCHFTGSLFRKRASEIWQLSREQPTDTDNMLFLDGMATEPALCADGATDDVLQSQHLKIQRPHVGHLRATGPESFLRPSRASTVGVGVTGTRPSRATVLPLALLRHRPARSNVSAAGGHTRSMRAASPALR